MGKLFSFKSKKKVDYSTVVSGMGRKNLYSLSSNDISGTTHYEMALYDKLRASVPVIDSAILKLVRLVGGFKVITEDESVQKELDRILNDIPSGISNTGISSFMDSYFESLLTYGNAIGEIMLSENCDSISGLFNGNMKEVKVTSGGSPFNKEYFLRNNSGEYEKLENPQLIMFTALNPPPSSPYGVSVLRGLPSISSILLRIYECIGQNFDRAGNIRYAVTYKPTDASDKAYAKERAMQIAKEWSDGMNSSKYGDVKDFISVGDVDIKVIGADSQVIDTEIPVRQLLEQIIAKLSIPPFLLGFSWSSTERMSSQQADILTSELEYYRRLLTPVIIKVAETALRLMGSYSDIRVLWDDINLQDSVELANARLSNAKAMEIEEKLNIERTE